MNDRCTLLAPADAIEAPATGFQMCWGASMGRLGFLRGRCAFLGAVLVLGVAAGCASTPAARFHTLLPVQRPAPEAGAGENAGPAFRIERVRVPAAVDQPQWLVRLDDGSLALLEQERWASPLPDEIAQALREVLRLRYGLPEAGPGERTPAWRVRIDVSRFETLPGEARLEAVWSLVPGQAGMPPLVCSSWFQEPATGGMAGLAEAHRRNVGRLGAVIGAQLQALHRRGSGECPA